MKQDSINKIKSQALTWVLNALVGLLCFLVKDMREDIKQIMQVVPALQAKVDMMNDQRLIDKFRVLQVMPGKEPEEEITYDSLNHKR
jgi:hypothetical protein